MNGISGTSTSLVTHVLKVRSNTKRDGAEIESVLGPGVSRDPG